MNRKLRLPPAPSSSTSLPRMSDGMRSGVNWMRRASRPSTMPMVSTSLVLARPGRPISSACPPQSTVMSACSTTRSCPKITLPIAALAAATWAPVASACRTIMSSSFSSPSVATAMTSAPCYPAVIRVCQGPDRQSRPTGLTKKRATFGPNITCGDGSALRIHLQTAWRLRSFPPGAIPPRVRTCQGRPATNSAEGAVNA